MKSKLLIASFTAIFAVLAVPTAFADSVDPFFVWSNMKGAVYDTDTNLIHFDLFSGNDLRQYYLQAWVGDRYITSDNIHDLEPNSTGIYEFEVPKPFDELNSFQLITKTQNNQVGGAWFYQP